MHKIFTQSARLSLIAVLLVICVFAGVANAANRVYEGYDGGAGNYQAVSGNWSIQGGGYQQSSTTGTSVTSINGKRWGDATYEFDLKLNNNGGDNYNWAGLQFKKMLKNDYPYDSGLTVFFRGNGDISLYRVNKTLASASTGLSFSSYKHVKIENSGSNIKVYINNEVTPRINYNDNTFASGYAGFVTYNSSWSFDNLSITGGELPYQIDIGPEELLYASAQIPSALDHMDSTLATMKINSTTFYSYAAGSTSPDLKKFSGTIDNPLQTTVSTSVPFDKNGHDAGYTYYEIWMPSIYKIGTNELLGFTHNEKYPPGYPHGGARFFSLGLAYSSDNGASWEYLGEILKPQVQTDNVGGVPFIIVGDYFYIYFNDGNHTTPDSYPIYIGAARANVTDVINAARNNQVSTWYKYKNGSWNENAMTGLSSPIIDHVYGLEDSHADAVYNTEINKYLMTVQTHNASKLCLYSSSDGITWSMEALVDSASTGSVMQPYSTFMDLDGASDDMSVVDGEFNILYPRKTWTNYTNDDIYKKHITITKNQDDIFRASSDYSSTQGSDGWFYKQWNGSSYSNLTWDAPNKNWVGASVYTIVSENWMHPDTQDAVRAWTAPSSGTVRITGTARKSEVAASGDGVNVKILKNGTQIWPSSGWQAIAGTDTTGYSHDLAVDVASGDTIYFILNKNGTNAYDSTYWDPKVQYDSYNAIAGFSSTQGNNQWSYQQWNGTTYSNMTWDATNGRWQGGSTYTLIGSYWQHPDTNDSVRTWTAPKAGMVKITGTPRKEASGGDGVQVKIMKNGTQIWPSSGWKDIASSNTTGINHDLAVTVAANDKIYFIVNKKGTINFDTTVWSPTVEYAGY